MIKSGDIVVCVDATNDSLELNREYVVDSTHYINDALATNGRVDFVTLRELDGLLFLTRRFVKAGDDEPQVEVDYNLWET